MSFSVSGISSGSVLLNYGLSQSRLQTALTEVSSGVTTGVPGENPAGTAIAALLQAGVNGAAEGESNDQTALDALNVAGGTAQSTEGILQQLNSLAVEASSDLLQPSDRADIQTQANQLLQQIDTNATQSSFNGIPLFGGRALSVQGGGSEGNVTSAQTPSATAASLGLSGLDFSSTASAQQAQTSIQNALTQLSSQQAQIGAQQIALNEDVDDENTLSTNLQASESAVADTNVPQAVTAANAASIQGQIDLSVLSAVNQENSTLAGIYINSLA